MQLCVHAMLTFSLHVKSGGPYINRYDKEESISPFKVTQLCVLPLSQMNAMAGPHESTTTWIYNHMETIGYVESCEKPHNTFIRPATWVAAQSKRGEGSQRIG